MPYLVILSANSDLAQACARHYAAIGYHLYLVARDQGKADALSKGFAKELEQTYGINTRCLALDILDHTQHQEFVQALYTDDIATQPEGLLIFSGYLGKQQVAQEDPLEAQLIINTNFSSLVGLCELFAKQLIERKTGFIVGISSVAGDRGRKSNYIYGASKSAFSTYLSGLSHRLRENQIQVLTVKAGFVRTRMTEGLAFPSWLSAQPESVAGQIVAAQQAGHALIYTPTKWRWIMWLIKALPNALFHRSEL